MKQTKLRNDRVVCKWVWGVGLLILALGSCAESSNMSGSGVKSENPAGSGDSDVKTKGKATDSPLVPGAERAELQRYTESFTVQLLEETRVVERPVDMLWVIDGSASMVPKVTAVAQGLEAFAKAMNKDTVTSKLKVTVIGPLEQSMVQKLKSAGVHIVQSSVHSYDQLPVAASYLSSDYTQYHLRAADCGDTASAVPPTSLLAAHPQSTFFRNQAALKIIVVVSDGGECPCWQESSSGVITHEPVHVCFSRFMEGLGYDDGSLRFYGFVDLDLPSTTTGPVVNIQGTNKDYHNLVSEWGGKLWNISGSAAKKWGKVLAEAQKELVRDLLKKVFTLEQEAKVVVSVKVGDKTLEKADFHAAGGKLHITTSEVSAGDKVEVVYLGDKE